MALDLSLIENNQVQKVKL